MSVHPRHLINIGVFSAIYLVVFLATSALGFLGLPFLFVGWVLGTIVNGAIVALYRRRTPLPYAMTALGGIEGLVAISRGYSIYTLIGACILGLLADGILRAGGQERSPLFAISYGLFATWIALPFAPLLINRDAYFATLAQTVSNQTYVNTLQAWLTPGVLIGWMVALFITGVFGGWFGQSMMRKHFDPSGVGNG